MSSLESPQDLRQRNQRTALYLVGWILLMVVASIIAVWVRN